jgi:hypothetical protein
MKPDNYFETDYFNSHLSKLYISKVIATADFDYFKRLADYFIMLISLLEFINAYYFIEDFGFKFNFAMT